MRKEPGKIKEKKNAKRKAVCWGEYLKPPCFYNHRICPQPLHNSSLRIIGPKATPAGSIATTSVMLFKLLAMA